MRETTTDLSVTMTSFFMKCVGFWLAEDSKDVTKRKVALYYTLCAISFALYVESVDFYHNWGDFSELAYISCNIMALVIVLYKITVLTIYREDFMNLIVYTQTNFWNSDYDQVCSGILNACKKRCIVFVCSFTFFAQGTIVCYTITPIFENVGRNESDRVLPFKMWIDFPFSLSPYYEITFVTQILSLYHSGICYFSFDNFLCILNVHAAGQFRMLQYRLSRISKPPDNEIYPGAKQIPSDVIYENFKYCIRQYQALIEYSKQLEKVFTFIILGQVLLFSLLICLVGYQVLLADGPPARRAIFICHICGTLVQLWMLTFSCNGLIDSSLLIIDSTFGSEWYDTPTDEAGRKLRKDIVITILRARRPCCLTAGGFFPVSLETYTTVMSTAMSYFTLMRQQSGKA